MEESLSKKLLNLFEEDKFNSQQIVTLKKEWASVDKINPSSLKFKELKTYIDGLSKNQLQQLVDADIKFISVIARNKLRN